MMISSGRECFWAFCMAAAVAPSIARERSDDLQEVVVTGVFYKADKRDASIAISTVSADDIREQVPASAADILKAVPGVFVNSSLGEIRNIVYSRGVSAGSVEAASGYYYV